jgi:hypothetical protein
METMKLSEVLNTVEKMIGKFGLSSEHIKQLKPRRETPEPIFKRSSSE